MKEYKFEGILKRGKENTRLLISEEDKFWTIKVPTPQSETVKKEGILKTDRSVEEAKQSQIDFIKNQGRNLVKREAKVKDVQLVEVTIVSILNQGDYNDRILVDYEGKYFTCLRPTKDENIPNQLVKADNSKLVEAKPEQIAKGTVKEVNKSVSDGPKEATPSSMQGFDDL